MGPPSTPRQPGKDGMTTTTKGWGNFRVALNPTDDAEVPGIPDAQQEARLTPGIQPPYKRRG